ncbi:MAG: DegT/DnrJ/EryC1/StrS aminotransferase family protein [Treponema sp.]|jgi:dTDP-4-amino-4,6-dideoxygalactose transaminase|nr:DegT/DnrJ/EryC1/StrS aminotransferase family protein [Treponema sp.]
MKNDLKVQFALPCIGKEEEEACLRVLRSGWLTTGPEALAFEDEFAIFLNGVRNSRNESPVHCLAVNSATAGLHLALEACGVGVGDIVFTPSYTFASTAEVVRYLGAEPVFIDIAPGTFHLDPAALEQTLERLDRGLPPYAARGGFGPQGSPKAVIPVHFGGLSSDMEAIGTVAKKYGLKVIEDAAHSFPSETENGFLGTIGDVGVFSFYATKTITTGEGGMVAVRDAEIAERVRLMRLHGIDRTVWNRYTDTKAPWYYEIRAPGYKYNMPDILAAIGRVQLARCRELLAMRQRIGSAYDAAFAGDDRFIIARTGEGDARQLYPLRLADSLSRDSFITKMGDAGIGVSVHFIPLHTMPFYRKRNGFYEGDFPETLNAFRREVSLPIWAGMTDEQVAYVINTARAPDFK